MNVNLLAQQIRDCQRCSLGARRVQAVPGQGLAPSPMMLIGEGPGHTEDMLGMPFIGRSGELLRDCLIDADCPPEQVWLTNLVKCRCVSYDVNAHGVAQSLKDAPPTQTNLDTVTQCLEWLDQEVKLVQPEVIVCIGGPSATTLLGKKVNVSKVQRQWFIRHRYSPIPLRVVYHPAYICRKERDDPRGYERLRDDLIGELALCRDHARKQLA